MSAAWPAAIPLLVALGLLLYVRRRRHVASALGDPELVRRIAGEDLSAMPWRRVTLTLLGAAALAAALVGATWRADPPADAVPRGPLILVLDASSSMLVRDLEPDRLERQRAAARAAVRALEGRAIGIVVFAGRAYALAPPTPDRGALELYLDALDPGIVTQTGSSLSAALRQALALLLRGGDGGGSILLITDGDARESDEEVARTAAIARRAGVPIYVLGAGTPAGGPVPDVDFRSGTARGFKQEPGGGVAISRLREDRLRQVARTSGGAYAPLGEPAAVAAMLERLRAGSLGGAAEGQRGSDYQWFAAAALALLAADAAASRRWRRA